jgi:hypothetical protein
MINHIYDYIKSHHEKIFIYGLYSSYVLFIIVLLGVSTTAPKYLSSLEKFLKLYVSLFLLWRFNPLRKKPFRRFDRRVVFSCALFLLTTTILTDAVIIYLEKVKGKVVNFLKIK